MSAGFREKLKSFLGFSPIAKTAGKSPDKYRTGLIFGFCCAFVSFLLAAGGFFRGLDNYLNALIFQFGYQLPKTNNQIVIVKKDQATSELIGKNPDRTEFASMFSLLGNPQLAERSTSVRAQKLEIFRLDIGLFSNVRDLPIRSSFNEWSGFLDGTETLKMADSDPFNQEKWRSMSRQVRDCFKAAPERPGLNVLMQAEGQFWLPKGQNAFKVLAGGRNPLILPTLMTDWTSEEVYQQVFPDESIDEEDDSAASKSDEQAPRVLLERWQNILTGLGTADFSLKISLFPKKNTVMSIVFLMTTPGLPREYLVEPAGVIAFDFVLQGQKEPSVDQNLEAVIASSSSAIVLAAHTKIEEEHIVEDSDTASSDTGGYQPHQVSGSGILQTRTRQILPLNNFVKSNTRVAMIDISTGNKSYVTEVPLFVADEDKKRLMPSFNLLVAMLALDAKKNENYYEKAMQDELKRIYPDFARGAFKGPLKINDLEIPVNAQGRMILDFAGSTVKGKMGKPAIESVSLFECLDKKTLESFYAQNPNKKLKAAFAHNRTLSYGNNKGGKIMIAGPFELSDFDFYPTPLNLDTPFMVQKDPLMGVEIHANAILNIVEQRYIKHPNAWHTIFALFLSCLLLGFLLDILSPVTGAFLTLAFVAGAFWQAFESYHVGRQLFNFSSLVVAYPLIWALDTLTNYIRQRARAQTTKDMFSRFVAADVVQYMLDNPELVKPGGDKVELTIFFSDVAGFTSISEALTPEELVILLNEYLGAMTDLLFEYGGTLDKFIGDAVMAFWNFPKQQDDHPVRACLCALAMQRKINELQIGWAKRGLPRVAARAGVNTANVVVGYMGSNKAQMNFTCMGDGVNLASRLEGANKEYGTMMMVSDATFQRVKHVITGRFLDFLAVKGKKEPVKVFELVSEKGKEPFGWFELAELYDRAIQLHLERKWDEAIATFEEILSRWPNDGPSATYIKRCQEYKEAPPPEGWDGRYILTHK
ncbi:MAG: CHASE2 domain-containing protein [Erysipelotrichia bacterium]|nr:CHASE2 domain-containing protein [Erysipelotrichia bacterium]